MTVRSVPERGSYVSVARLAPDAVKCITDQQWLCNVNVWDESLLIWAADVCLGPMVIVCSIRALKKLSEHNRWEDTLLAAGSVLINRSAAEDVSFMLVLGSRRQTFHSLVLIVAYSGQDLHTYT